MENKEKNKDIPLRTVTILLVVVILALAITIILGINHNNKQEQLIAKLEGELQKRKGNELEEFIGMLQREPEEYLTMVGLTSNKKLPTFTNINEAELEWVWKNVRDCMEYMAKESFEYQDIINYAKVIYGDNFNLELPKEGGYGFIYYSKSNQYSIDEIAENMENEDIYFTVKNVDKNEKQAVVEIVEYTIKEEENEEQQNGDEYKETLSLYDNVGNFVKSYEIDYENDDDYMEKWEEIEKDSKEMKASKKIKLELNEKQVYNIISISNI